MKNNRILTAILAALLLASTLASCSRRDQFRPPETDVPTGEQTTVAGQPDVSNPGESNPNGGEVTGPNTTTTPDIPIGDPSMGDAESGKITGNPYEGWTAEELYASFMEDQERSVYNDINNVYGNTPYYVILDVQYGGAMFSKLTGQVVTICKDPLCDHETCIFSNLTLRMLWCQVVNDRIYLTVDQDIDQTVTYSFDLLMNDVEVVYEWNGTDCPDKVYIYQDKIYYDASKRFDDGQYGKVTMVYDMREKTTYSLREQPARRISCWYVGAYEWYTAEEDGSLRRYNLDTGVDEAILDGSWLNREMGETSVRFAGASDQTAYVWKSTVSAIPSNVWKLNMETGVMQDTGVQALFVYDDILYAKISHNNDAYKNDTHYEYYFNDSVLTKFAGKVYQLDMNTGELNTEVQLRTDGIPDYVGNLLFMDGHFLMIEYQTYKDFNNYYSPNLPGWAESRRYVVVNLETGTVYELGVDLSTQSYHNRPGRS